MIKQNFILVLGFHNFVVLLTFAMATISEVETNPETAVVRRQKILDKTTGIQVVKGGQSIYAGFLESILTAYSNLCNSPTILVYLVVITIAAFAEMNGSNGPLEMMKSNIYKTSTSTTNKILAGLAKVFLLLLDFLISNKSLFIVSSLMFIPYLAKPSRHNFTITVVLTLVVTLGGFPLWDILLFSQMFFLYTQIRAPMYRTLILAGGVMVFILGMELIHSTMSNAKSGTAKATAATPTAASVSKT